MITLLTQFELQSSYRLNSNLRTPTSVGLATWAGCMLDAQRRLGAAVQSILHAGMFANIRPISLCVGVSECSATTSHVQAHIYPTPRAVSNLMRCC